uniref:Uncharacterized protein n=1 Tax=Arundo donax TaxID=35708 RepID=A0A0A8ZFB0_ARUDO
MDNTCFCSLYVSTVCTYSFLNLHIFGAPRYIHSLYIGQFVRVTTHTPRVPL